VSSVARTRGAWLRSALPLVVTGFGLGAFLDGIVLHQVLQWHHLVVEYRSADDLEGLEANTFWDGVFHLAAWAVVVVGLLWTARRRAELRVVRWRPLLGALLVGWGSFNVTDQVVFHLLLGAHHIRMVEEYQLYDWGYTAVGAVLIAAGLLLGRDGPRRSAPPRDVSSGTPSSG
jgi:uncharacterized membrane protein